LRCNPAVASSYESVRTLALHKLRSFLPGLGQPGHLQHITSLLPAIAESTAQKVFEKMEIASAVISFSSVKTKQYERVTNLLRFKIKGATWTNKNGVPETNTQVHTWLDGNEDSPENIDAYMKYINSALKSNFRWEDEHVYVDCNEKGLQLKSLLNTYNFDGQHSTSGNIDVVLVVSADANNNAIKNNIELGLELKHTKNEGEHERQVILQHLAASFLNEGYPVLTLLTDLSRRFNFYWFGKEEKIIWKYKASFADAMYLLDHMFENDAGESAKKDMFPVDFLIGERGTWTNFNTTFKMDTIEENGNENGYGDDSDGDQRKEDSSDAKQQKEEDTAGTKRDNTGNPVGEKKGKKDHQSKSSSGGRYTGINSKRGQEDLSVVLGFETLEEHEKGEAVLEYLACNVLPNVVLT